MKRTLSLNKVMDVSKFKHGHIFGDVRTESNLKQIKAWPYLDIFRLLPPGNKFRLHERHSCRVVLQMC